MKNNQLTFRLENRRTDRVPTELRTIVQVKESEDESWKEVTKVNTVSRNGAGFSLSRKCEIGRLLTLVMPMPAELRAYDKDKELYPIMGLVQNCYEATADGETVYHVGVALIGKQIPESFTADPQQSYRICGMTKDGLWQIADAETPFKQRKNPRFWIALDVTISLMQKGKKSASSVFKEETTTQNIGASGVSVMCSLEAKVGDRVKFACKEHDFYAIAIVRNRKEPEGQLMTLHLEFVDDKFPMEKILFTMPANPAPSAMEPKPELPPMPPQTVAGEQFELRRF